eukprot:SAG31_NODE_360_length_17025_cov_5.362460_12_plen_111_part_00
MTQFHAAKLLSIQKFSAMATIIDESFLLPLISMVGLVALHEGIVRLLNNCHQALNVMVFKNTTKYPATLYMSFSPYYIVILKLFEIWSLSPNLSHQIFLKNSGLVNPSSY